MALSPQLLQYKSSGVYRLEFDKSQTSNIPAGTLRLVVGHSKKGPYNSPVLVSTTEQFIEVFGSIDKNLEKSGMFFHRSALAALTRGPILALNLASFAAGDNINSVGLITRVPDIAAGELSPSVQSKSSAYHRYFNTEKFWSPSDEALNDEIGTFEDNVLRFANIKQDNLTVFVRKAKDVKAFDILARDWYGEAEVPSFMNAFDYVSDYMVDVFVFKGEFNAAAMAMDPVYGEFFTTAGLKKDKLAEFANLRQVSLLAKYTGSLIPGFTDVEGTNMYIESIINGEARRTGLFCAVQEDAVLDGKVDLVGHVYDDATSYELLSYNLGAGQREVDLDTDFTYTVASGAFVEFDATATVSYNPNPVITIPSPGDDGINPVTSTVVANVLTFTNYDIAATGDISVGDFLAGTNGAYAKVTSVVGGVVTCDVDIFPNYAIDTTAGAVMITSYEEVISALPSLDLAAGDYLKGNEANRMVKVLRIAKTMGVDAQSGLATVNYKVYTSAEALNAVAFAHKAYKSFEAVEEHYVPFVLGAAALPSNNSIKECLDVLNLGTGLANALVDKDNIDFRYIVDTFASLSGGELLNKVQLSALAKERQNASAIVNAPFIAEFKKSADPSFTNGEGDFDINYIATGGNLDKNPTALFALPGINDGANYAFYYTALVARENNKDIIVPSAAYVSNNFIDKYTDSAPWAIVAGPRRGVISGSGIVGAEYAFDKADRDVLEPFGINPIVFQRGAGLTILGNKTAQQSVQSALSSAHVREVLIYIQDGLAAILKDYVFEFNTPQTRLEIKTLADSFLESVKADSGVYDFKNVMDSTNNTNEVIDANIGILDTFVEPVKGLEIVVQRTTVLNTGEIATGNFS